MSVPTHPSSARILQVSATPLGKIGGMERVVDDVAAGLRTRGHSVAQAFLGASTVEVEPGLWTLRLPAPRTWRKVPSPASAFQIARAAVRLGAVLRAVRPDVVHFNYVTWETAYFVLLRPLFRYRLVVTAHGSDLLRTEWPVAKAVLPHVLRRADTVTVVSDTLSDAAASLAGGARPVVVRNGVDTAFWSPGRSDSDRRSPTVVSVGRLERVKGYDVLIEAFTRVRARVPGARLVLVGDGSEREALGERVAALGVGESVEFAGTLAPEAVRARLRNADAFALPSRSEGLPLSLLEAMAVGVPAVASDVGGVATAAADAAALVPSEDVGALAAAVEAVLTDPEYARTLRGRGRGRVEGFSQGTMLDTYEALLTEQAPRTATSKTVGGARSAWTSTARWTARRWAGRRGRRGRGTAGAKGSRHVGRGAAPNGPRDAPSARS